MKHTGKAPFSLGMEIEQIGHRLPSGYYSSELDWELDGSGPMEATIGGPKTTAAMLARFYRATRDSIGTWEWHAASNTSGQANGCGSHVHLGLVPRVFEDDVVANTIAYNSVIELAPFFAPFWCHDWERGFRHGTYYGGTFATARGEPNIDTWAVPQTVRASPMSMRRILRGSRAPGTTSYPSIRANKSRESENKPFTCEIRMNDGHPAMALAGLLLLRRVVGNAIERGDSVKLANRDATLRALYNAIYTEARSEGLMTVMKRPLPSGEIRFMEGRGLPGISALTFETPFDVLCALQSKYQTCSVAESRMSRRPNELVRTGDDRNSPSRNNRTLWDVDAPEGEFTWEHGPADRDYVGREADTEPVVIERVEELDAADDGLGELFG